MLSRQPCTIEEFDPAVIQANWEVASGASRTTTVPPPLCGAIAGRGITLTGENFRNLHLGEGVRCLGVLIPGDTFGMRPEFVFGVVVFTSQGEKPWEADQFIYIGDEREDKPLKKRLNGKILGQAIVAVRI